jgi:hypothetical protein
MRRSPTSGGRRPQAVFGVMREVCRDPGVSSLALEGVDRANGIYRGGQGTSRVRNAGKGRFWVLGTELWVRLFR